MRVTTSDGQYTVVLEEDFRLHALRYGHQWRDCVGDQLILCLASDLEAARKQVQNIKNYLKEEIACLEFCMESGNWPSSFDPVGRLRTMKDVLYWVEHNTGEGE